MRALSGMPRRAALLLLRVYLCALSPLIGPRCRYHPSCSEYAVESIERFGLLRGLVLASWRLLRCNPLSRGGFDYPADQRLFAAGPAAHPKP